MFRITWIVVPIFMERFHNNRIKQTSSWKLLGMQNLKQFEWIIVILNRIITYYLAHSLIFGYLTQINFFFIKFFSVLFAL